MLHTARVKALGQERCQERWSRDFAAGKKDGFVLSVYPEDVDFDQTDLRRGDDVVEALAPVDMVIGYFFDVWKDGRLHPDILANIVNLCIRVTASYDDDYR